MTIDSLIDYYERRRVEIYEEKEILLENESDYSYVLHILQAKYDETVLFIDNLNKLKDETI